MAVKEKRETHHMRFIFVGRAANEHATRVLSFFFRISGLMRLLLGDVCFCCRFTIGRRTVQIPEGGMMAFLVVVQTDIIQQCANQTRFPDHFASLSVLDCWCLDKSFGNVQHVPLPRMMPARSEGAYVFIFCESKMISALPAYAHALTRTVERICSSESCRTFPVRILQCRAVPLILLNRTASLSRGVQHQRGD